jgi:hypothetical protein
MKREDVLTSLMAQAKDEGASLITLRAIVEEGSMLGTDRALARLGLGDAGAESDLGELRELLRAWRDAKSSAWKAFVGWVVRGALALVLIGIAVKLGAWKLL